jgi:hypothetical protein
MDEHLFKIIVGNAVGRAFNNYDKGPHLDWWHSLSGSECFKMMKKYDFKQVNNKIIYMIWSREFPKENNQNK